MRTLRGHITLALIVSVALLATLLVRPAGLGAEDVYKAVPGWAQELPNGMKWGETSGMAIDARGIILAFPRAETPRSRPMGTSL